MTRDLHTHDGYVQANKAYFDEHAHKLEEMHTVHSEERARRVVSAMLNAWPQLFDEDHTVAMDYACGIGMLSRQLCQYVRSVVGVDISQASVDYYNKHASNQGLSADEMRAVCAELKGQPGELDDIKFDLVVCCACYHHFPSLEDTTRNLASLLKPGGSLLVADIKAADDNRELFPEQHHHIVPHKHGLSEETMRRTFDSVGLVEFDMRDAFRAKMRATGEEMQWFVVRGVKPLR